ncbi:MAG: hypothetical protein JST79_10510 [Acidobacteria bacterium]|jgi:hypothetical protein|nr:hypothetical protein [Acidobacteriota bacterium]
MWKKTFCLWCFLLAMYTCSQASTVTLSWSYDYTGLTLCSGTVSKNCLDHFEMLDATSGTPALLGTVANPANASGKVSAITGTFQTSNFGQRIFAVTAVGRDNSGNFVSSDWSKCQATVQVVPSSPGTLSSTVQ